MISIVVCSVNEELFKQFSHSVELIIGLPYEIIRIDNIKKTYSICGAYNNKGKAICKYDIIGFIHEDIIFKTNNWGRVLEGILKNKEIGLVGILGTCYLSLFPSGYFDNNDT
jgi:hypothetical protein